MTLLLFLFPLVGVVVLGWWDESHAVIGAVARRSLPSGVTPHIEALLRAWDEDYPGLGTLPLSSIWADRLKCDGPGVACNGLPRFDGVEIFSNWHYVSIPYNPQGIDLGILAVALPLPQTGAVWSLSAIWDSITFGHRPERHHRSRTRRGTTFSTNLLIRLLVHILGDLHQPLHATEVFSAAHPGGDYGGTRILMDPNCTAFKWFYNPPRDLHQFWDSCGGLMETPWPAFRAADVDLQAKGIMEEFPPESFGPRFEGELKGFNFSAVADDTHKVATQIAYSEFDWDSDEPMKIPYCPSKEYVGLSQRIARQQLALGGYRLAAVLAEAAGMLPEVHEIHAPIGWVARAVPLYGAAAVIGVLAVALYVQTRRRQILEREVAARALL